YAPATPDPLAFQAFRPDPGGYSSSPSDPGGFAAVRPDPTERGDAGLFDPFAPDPGSGYRDAINDPGRYDPGPYPPSVRDPAPARFEMGTGEAGRPEQRSDRDG